MKMLIFIVLSAVLLITVTASCAIEKKTDTAGTTVVDANRTNVKDIPDADAVFVTAPGGAADFRTTVDGSVRFEKDTANKVSVDFPADGTEKSLALTDVNGMTWKLDIPGDALLLPQTITMTAMKNIESDLGVVSGGVVLEPDGLRFSSPATLTVMGGGVGKSGMLFSGDGEGRNLELAVMEREETFVRMAVFHFSTDCVTNDENTIDGLSKQAAEMRKAAEEAAKSLLKKPLEIVEPPRIMIKCHHLTEARDQVLIDEYTRDFGKPESDVLQALVSSARAVQLTATSGVEEEWDRSLERKVADRLVKKARSLIKMYYGKDEEMYSAVAVAAYQAEKTSALLANDGEWDYDRSLMPQIAAWAQQIAEKYLTGLNDQHEYKNIHPIMKMIREAAILGVSDSSCSEMMEKFEKALTFRIETTDHLSIDTKAKADYIVDSKADIELLGNSGMINQASADGTGVYTSFRTAITGQVANAKSDTEGLTFPVVFSILGFDPCRSNTFDIYVDRFGAQNESLTAILPGASYNVSSVPMVEGVTSGIFRGRFIKDIGMYKFTVDLHDGQKTAAEQSFTGTYEKSQVDYSVKFIHTP